MPKVTYRDCFNQQEIDQLAAIGTAINNGSFVYDDHKVFLSDCAKKALKKEIGEKPQLLFLGSLQHILSDIIKDATQARGVNQFKFLSSEALFRHAIDEAWGAGSFKYIKWSNSKASLNSAYSGPTPDWVERRSLPGDLSSENESPLAAREIQSKLKLYPNDESPHGYLLDVIAPGMSKAVCYQYAQVIPHGGSNGGLFGEKEDMDALTEHIKGLLNSEGLSSKETIEIFFGENNYSKRALEGFCEYLAFNQGSVDGFAMHFQQDITRSMQQLPNGAFDIPAAPSLSSFKEFDTMSNTPFKLNTPESHFPAITGTIITDHDDASYHRDMTISFLNYLKNYAVNEGESTIIDAVENLDASDISDTFYYSLSPVHVMPDAPQGFRVEIEEEAMAALTSFFGINESDTITLEMVEQALSAYETQLARETITFHLPCDNQAKDNDHEANLAVVLNKQDFDRFAHMKGVAHEMGFSSIQVAPETEKGCALSIDLTGITFDSTETPLYWSTFSVAANDQIEVQAYGGYDEVGEYVSYDGIKLTDLKNAYSHAVERGAKHVTIDAHSMEAHFTLEQPEVVTEQSLCGSLSLVIDEPLGEPLDLSKNHNPAASIQAKGPGE